MNRIPKLEIPEHYPREGSNELVAEWAEQLYHANLAFHPDDDFRDVLNDDGSRKFTDEETDVLRATLEKFTTEEVEVYCEAVLAAHAANNAYFARMDPPSPDEQLREAVGGRPDLAICVGADLVTVCEIARVALSKWSNSVGIELDLSDPELVRLRDKLSSIMDISTTPRNGTR